MDDRKKHGWGFWLTVALTGLPVLYVLSFGPACWVVSRSQTARLPVVYLPVGWAGMNGPETLRTAICWYAHVGMPNDSGVILPVDSSGLEVWLTPTR